jgi:hypothetical protein
MTVKEIRAFDRLIYQTDTCRIFHCNSNEQRLVVMDTTRDNCLQWHCIVDMHPQKYDYFLIYFLIYFL